jgi:hypothetical protein
MLSYGDLLAMEYDHLNMRQEPASVITPRQPPATPCNDIGTYEKMWAGDARTSRRL